MNSTVDTCSSVKPSQTTLESTCHEGEGHPDTAYPPSSYIDFASGDLGPSFSPTRPSHVSFHCQWLGGSHDGYPLATTLDEYMELRQTGDTLGTLEHAALVQSQLTFGLLEAFLRIKIPENFFPLTKQPDVTTILSTANLPVLVRDWYHRSRVRHHPDQCQSWLNDAEATLSDADRRLRVYKWDADSNPFLAAGLSLEVSEEIIRTMCVIGESFMLALVCRPSECPPARVMEALQFPHNIDSNAAEQQLRAQGWCPFTIAAALGSFRFTVLEYAKSFRPFLRHSGEHDGCTDLACRVNNIDPTTYTGKHTSDECDCPSITAPTYLVESMLSHGRIPIVAFCNGKLSVLGCEDKPYVSISHTWIDGLGSTTEEGLPSCQVSRIASMASSLVPGGAFWIDALCVPGQKDLRKQAVQLMANTYANAAVVLVVDSGIRSCSKDAPLEEKLLRVVTSGWMQRLWTYQEAMLAKKLCFEFRDGLVNLVEDLDTSSEAFYASPLLAEIMQPLKDIYVRALGDRSARAELTIGRAARAIQWRTTSRAEDETLAIAGLLHIDVRQLLSAPSPDERMKSLFLQHGKVDPAIIFATGPKMSGIPGFSWAPRSLMTGPHPGKWMEEASAVCTPSGLLADYPALVLSEPVELDEDMAYVVHDTTQPAVCYLLQRVKLVRDRKRELCDALLVHLELPSAPGIHRACAGVRILSTVKEIASDNEDVQVCRYQDVVFNVLTIETSIVPQLQHPKIQVINAKPHSRMKVRVI